MEEDYRELKAFLKVWFKVLLCFIYIFYIVSKLPKGKLRLFSLLPIFYLFTIFPLSLTTPTSTGITGFFLAWLANFRLLLFSFDLGPLTYDCARKSLLNFILIATFPITIPQNNNASSQKLKFDQKLPLTLRSKSLIFCLFLLAGSFSRDYHKSVNPNVLLVLFAIVIYLYTEIIFGLCNKFMGFVLGVELSPPFNEPYISSSLQDFWGRRWNLIVSDLLRHTIYLPIRSFLEIRLGKMFAVASGVLASFVVSGLMHELFYYYVTRVTPTWEVTCFFVLHGFCLILEFGLKRAFVSRNWALHWGLTSPLTVVFVIGTSFWLFFPQLVRNKADVRALEEIQGVVKCFKGLLGSILEIF